MPNTPYSRKETVVFFDFILKKHEIGYFFLAQMRVFSLAYRPKKVQLANETAVYGGFAVSLKRKTLLKSKKTKKLGRHFDWLSEHLRANSIRVFARMLCAALRVF